MAEPSPSAASPPTAAPPGLGWLWLLLGAAGATLAGLGAGRWRRRRGAEAVADVPVVAVPPVPPRPAPLLPAKPHADAAPPTPSLPFELALADARVAFAPHAMLFEFELRLANLQPEAADAIRVSVAAISASAEQDRRIAGFHAAPIADPAAPPFALAPGQGGRLALRIALPREEVHVVDLGGRPIFVPLLLVDLRWRAGLGIRRFGADFMLGMPGQGGKLGPLRLDRPAPAGALAATRYHKPAA
ncbi:hypothetical protein [Sphingomonas hengshuiensis]|uniref:Uncharacterized protein n=1 Tax=Sphingomonas hengshuiensis TaxID=1609977 RepID=A0A7U4LF66_9SPHN|nr:hypothetical protein [Sphingomonas hengshuiensis]AJP72125.1 hypothetical protein TS85_10510 [Sphingomonas hengshuiensis]